MDNEEEVEMTKEESNEELCPGKNGLGVICGTTDKKAFYMQHPMKCSKIRFYGYKDSSGYYYIVMSGFELFGTLSIGNGECTCKRKHFQSISIFMMAILVVC